MGVKYLERYPPLPPLPAFPLHNRRLRNVRHKKHPPSRSPESRTEHSGPAPHPYPFTAPAVTPPTICRCIAIKKIRQGIIDMTIPGSACSQSEV